MTTPFNAPPYSDGENLKSIILQLLTEVRTTLPVKVIEVTNDGEVSPIGRLSIQPLVGQLSAAWNVLPHGIIYDVPYLRIQGGANAVIIDPQVGDIGIAAFCDRDISTVKATGKVGGPGSLRRHDLSDAVYLGTIMGGMPAQYIQFSPQGINIVSPAEVSITAPKISSKGEWAHTGSITVSDDVVASGISQVTHQHGGVARGGAMTSPPAAGVAGNKASFAAGLPAGMVL